MDESKRSITTFSLSFPFPTNKNGNSLCGITARLASRGLVLCYLKFEIVIAVIEEEISELLQVNTNSSSLHYLAC
jgi:hypothetical protein